jgi:hypothetical protein
VTRRHVIAALSLIGLGACLSPTLPLPPPEAPDAIAASETAGFWDVRGTCTPGARVLIKNLRTGVVTGRDDQSNTGRYFIHMPAELCDQAEVTEVVGTHTSDATFFVIEPVTNGLGDGSCE